ncbi:cell division ATP-binding protein FtsE [Hydrogenimonas thermophila]|uniref:Cell division transport system ATP-binding protein n=1 Tax=Hydrogenimonas thermophila TaxID=223786 RepID=A0A1I5NPF9_9BACT|nr:ABC transporter ATP-binding protein [Hydrogenimonas thermophila]WOE69303.1 ABC transporter ATP-binding protein [Hydrogenimonas thermophila]WOE71813.1 ABC transporter ATP-binding protein [Hydrogenimonas thermophila]SFP23567.1 cell division transport system ATP-binding protein [Hydrogenimonas thermophila]
MQNVIEANGLKLAYPQHEPVIKNATFTVKSSEFVFITGASGSGKSTLLKSFYGVIPPFGGSLIVGGVDMGRVRSSKLYKLRRHLGVVFQDYKLIKEWNVEKNVTLPLMIAGFSKDVSRTQAKKLLAHVKLSHKSDRYPMELSGGEQQRVAMARALAHNPFLILADEPTGNLDEYSSQVVWELLERANQDLKTTVVVVTHRIPEVLNIPYRHLMIENGAIYEIH